MLCGRTREERSRWRKMSQRPQVGGGRMLEEQAGGQSVRKGLIGHHEDLGCCPEGNGASSH